MFFYVRAISAATASNSFVLHLSLSVPQVPRGRTAQTRHHKPMLQLADVCVPVLGEPFGRFTISQC